MGSNVPSFRFFLDRHGDYMGVEMHTKRVCPQTGQTLYDARATCYVSGGPSSICSTSIGEEYMASCKEVTKDEVPPEWLTAMGYDTEVQ